MPTENKGTEVHFKAGGLYHGFIKPNSGHQPSPYPHFSGPIHFNQSESSSFMTAPVNHIMIANNIRQPHHPYNLLSNEAVGNLPGAGIPPGAIFRMPYDAMDAFKQTYFQGQSMGYLP